MSYKSCLAALLLSLGMGGAWASNGDLAKPQMVPAGERVANYLQSYLTTIGTIVEAKKSGGILEGSQTYRAIVVYNPDQQRLEISLVGSVEGPDTIQDMLEALKKIILGLNPKLQKYFGVTLDDADFSMDYLYAKTGKVLVRYRNGRYSTGTETDKTPALTASPQATPGT